MEKTVSASQPARAFAATSPMTVMGAGNWGTTIACLAAERGRPVRLWDRDVVRALDLEMVRQNRRSLPGVTFPISLGVGADLTSLLVDSPLVVVALPVPSIRETFRRHRHLFSRSQWIVSASKGLEHETGMRVSEIIVDELGPAFADQVGALSGPNLAPEIARKQPSSSVIASSNEALRRSVQEALSTDYFRVYTAADLVGVEIGGALKNIMAIASGIVDELRLGDNAKGALLTRGLAEITRFGVDFGARPLTFLGLSGMGDLVTTCSSDLSRNHTVGRLIARGRSLDAILSEMRMVAEGVNTTRSVHRISKERGIGMPIVDQIHSILFEGKDPRRAIRDLMLRELKSEEVA